MDQKEIETVLLNEIYRQYPSVRAFAKACGIPHGTIVSALLNQFVNMISMISKNKDCWLISRDLSDSKKDKVFEYMKDIR